MDLLPPNELYALAAAIAARELALGRSVVLAPGPNGTIQVEASPPAVLPGKNSAQPAVDDERNRLLSSDEVMRRLGYKRTGSFFAMVRSKGIPHVRINARVIKFPESGLEDWLRRRSSN